jgi:hypothetical protein
MDDISQGLQYFLQHEWLLRTDILCYCIDSLVSMVLVNTTLQKYYTATLKPKLVGMFASKDMPYLWRNYQHKSLTIFRLLGCSHPKSHDMVLIHIDKCDKTDAPYKAYVNTIMKSHNSTRLNCWLIKLDILRDRCSQEVLDISNYMSYVSQIMIIIKNLVDMWLSFSDRKGSEWRRVLLYNILRVYVGYTQICKNIGVYSRNVFHESGLLAFLSDLIIIEGSCDQPSLLESAIPYKIRKRLCKSLISEEVDDMLRCVEIIRNNDGIYNLCPYGTVEEMATMIIIHILDAHHDFDKMYNNLKKCGEFVLYYRERVGDVLSELVGDYINKNLFNFIYKLASLTFLPGVSGLMVQHAITRNTNDSIFWKNLKRVLTESHYKQHGFYRFYGIQEDLMKIFWTILSTKSIHSYHEEVVKYGAPEGFEFILPSHSGKRFIVFHTILEHLRSIEDDLCPICGETRRVCFEKKESSLFIFPEYKYVKQGDGPMVLLYF